MRASRPAIDHHLTFTLSASAVWSYLLLAASTRRLLGASTGAHGRSVMTYARGRPPGSESQAARCAGAEAGEAGAGRGRAAGGQEGAAGREGPS